MPTARGAAGAAMIGVVVALALGGRARAQESHRIVGVWVSATRTIPDPLPLSDAARQVLAAAEPPPALPCTGPGLPALLDTRAAVEITERGDKIRMHYTEWAATRTIYTNPRSGPPTQAPSPLGVSFGRWEGETLAIFTTYIAYPYFDRAGTPQTPAVTVLERYTPNADGTRLEWRTTVTDAATFTKPVVIAGAMSVAASAATAAVAEGTEAAPGAPSARAADAAVLLAAGGCVG